MPSWPPEGFVVHRGLADLDLVSDYVEEWGLDSPGESGFPGCTPFTHESAMRRLLLSPEVVDAVESIVGEPVGLHLALTGWVSTERTWHQDGYLNPPEVGDSYCGVWIALDEILSEAGPLEVIPGSQLWPGPSRQDVLDQLEEHERTDPNWPKLAERFVTAIWENEIERRSAPSYTFLGEKGDVLFWHPNLVHRGSPPAVPGTRRPCLIAHYSGLQRPDMTGRWIYEGAGAYLAP